MEQNKEIEQANRTQIKRAAKLIKDADALIFTNGAGLGCDSGLSTFRGRNRQDTGWPPIEKDIESPYSMAKPRRIDEDPHLAWGYSAYIYRAFKQAEPHAGYHIMKKWGEEKRGGYAVFTSNIDGHWRKVLCDVLKSVPLVEYHGTVDYMQCHTDCRDQIWDTDYATVAATKIDPETGRALTDRPSCPSCGGPARFNVCLIADDHYNADERSNQLTLWDKYVAKVKKTHKNVVIVEVGAGQSIPTVRRKSAELTRLLGAKLVRINLDEAELDSKVDVRHLIDTHMHVSIGGLGALEALSMIDEEMKKTV